VTRSRGTIQGTLRLKGNATRGSFKVVGGTGDYHGATGTGTYRNLDTKGERTAVTLKLA